MILLNKEMLNRSSNKHLLLVVMRINIEKLSLDHIISQLNKEDDRGTYKLFNQKEHKIPEKRRGYKT